MHIARLVFPAFFLVACLPPMSFAQDAGATVVKHGAINEDVYLAGGTVDVSAAVEGDVVAAGGQVNIGNSVSGDVIAAGGNVIIGARIGDDMRAAGGNVTISGSVGDHAVAAGGNVLLMQTASVGGRAWFGGSAVTVAGKVGKELKVAGNTVVISGQIGGDVEAYAQSLEIGPGAVIQGNLTYMSAHEARIAPDAKIVGTVTREFARAHTGHKPGAFARAMVGFAFYLSLMLTGVVLYVLFPAVAEGAARTIASVPWTALALGFAVLVATPIAVVILFATLVGAGLGLIALALYLLLLPAGFFVGVLYVGDVGLRLVGKSALPSKGWRALSIAVALVAVWLVGLVPIVGGLAVFALLLVGLGALTRYWWRRYLGRA